MDRDVVIAALRQTTWPEYLEEYLGGDPAGDVGPTLRPVIGARLGGDLELGCSKLGGLPHVDDAFEWPVEDGTDEPLALVCQINLDEAARVAGTGPTLTGLLYLFSIYDADRAYGHEIYDTTTAVVHVPAPGSLAVAEAPPGLEGEGVFDERRLTLAASYVTEGTHQDGKPIHARFQGAVEQRLDEILDAPTGPVRMLGNAHFFREEAREGYQPDRVALLLAVDGYDVARDAFGEGAFHVLVPTDALAAGRLDEAYVFFEVGT